jgi:transposase-like protein
MEDLGLELGEFRGDPVEELARFGARLVLTSYLDAEVKAHLGAERYQRSDLRRGWRNGRRTRKVTCGLGSLEVEMPKVRDTEAPFRSQVLDAWQRTSASMVSTLTSLYVEGLSTRDFGRALSPISDGTGLSRSAVSRANEQIKDAFAGWKKRRLEEEDVVYLFLDGHYEGVRFGVKGKESVLVAHGIRKDGSRTLLGVYLGCTESAESWKLALGDLTDRGLRAPLLVITDGAGGLIRAVKETWPTVARQRCVVHRVRNVLARIPKTEHERIRRELNRIFYAPSLDEALDAAERFAAKWKNVYPEAVTILGKDLADCLTFFRFPPRHWKRIRTSNELERCFEEVTRRTRVIRRFPDERAALSLIWTVMDEDAKTWRGIVMDSTHQQLVQAAILSLEENPIVVKGFEELLAA